MPDIFTSSKNRQLAFEKFESTGPLPGVVFLSGFRSDMQGSKAEFIANWARQTGRSFLRFDYSGHGQSSGDFLDGCIGDWAQDSRDIIAAKTRGRQILVGSSMGGWLALLVARSMPQRLAGLIGIAAAPDFTEDSMWAGFNDLQKQDLMQHGQVALPSDYSDDPYIITKKLIEDGRSQLVLRAPLNLPFPTRFLQGTDDRDVDCAVALRLLGHASGDDIRLTLVKGADHRFSTPDCLALIVKTIDQVSARSNSKNPNEKL